MIGFNAPWCAPCRVQEPIMDQLSEQFEGRAIIAAINIDRNRDLAEKLRIQSIPTLILYRDNKEINRFVGLQQGARRGESLQKALQQ